jgi:hypothetical protein
MSINTKNSTGKTLSNNVKNAANKTKELAQKVQNKTSELAGQAKNAVQKLGNNVTKKATNISNSTGISGTSSKLTAMTQEFFDSNTAISKFTGFFLCLLLFVIIFQIGMSLINRFITPSYNPYIINGLVPSDQTKIVSVNPAEKDSVPIYRSINQPQGIEYTWNVWFAVNNQVAPINDARIFSKGSSGSDNYNNTYMSEVNNKFVNVSPGLFLTKQYNKYTSEEDKKANDMNTTLLGYTFSGARDNLNNDETGPVKKTTDLSNNYTNATFITDAAKSLQDISGKLIPAITNINNILDSISTSDVFTAVNNVKLKLIETQNFNNSALALVKVGMTQKDATDAAYLTNQAKNSINAANNALQYAKNVGDNNAFKVDTLTDNLSSPNQYVLTLVMNTYDSSDNPSLYEKIIIENIPMQKWVCCTIRVQGVAVDVYINGMLKKRQTLNNVPKQNFYDIYIGESNGFKGYISNLKYYSYAINYNEVQSLFLAGPALKTIDDNMPLKKNDYLSVNWYFK